MKIKIDMILPILAILTVIIIGMVAINTGNNTLIWVDLFIIPLVFVAVGLYFISKA